MEEKGRGMRRRTWRGLLILGVLVILISFYFLIEPAAHAWVPKCPVKLMTGMDCPGCGSQRMIHALLHGDIPGAWKANAFILVSIPYILLFSVVETFPQRFSRLRRKLMSTTAIVIMLVLIIAWAVARNIFGW